MHFRAATFKDRYVQSRKFNENQFKNLVVNDQKKAIEPA